MKRLVLAGGGHAHVAVLADLARQPLPGWDITLVTPYDRQIYSGMLPGWLAGHYAIKSCAIELTALAARAGVRLLQTFASALDPVGNTLTCSNGTVLPFDILSLDIGPAAALDGLPGSREHAQALRPIEGFVAAWPAVMGRIAAAGCAFEVAVLGAGAGGLELAFAIRHRALQEGWTGLGVTLVGPDTLPLEGAPDRARRMARRMMAERQVTWRGGHRATGIRAGLMMFEGGASLPFDVCIAATGAAAPGWPAASGLAVDARGFVRVDSALRSVSHPHIFAAGDIAAHESPLPKSGVYAVRAGPVIARNLRAACTGVTPQPWTPQARALYLLSTGDRHAMAIWGGLAWRGNWVWRWKDWIDRGFVRGYSVRNSKA